jgi:hypothetical protein
LQVPNYIGRNEVVGGGVIFFKKRTIQQSHIFLCGL